MRELDSLARSRDELKLQIHLAKADAKSEWERLERTFRRIEEEVQRSASASKEPLAQLGDAARALLVELKSGYERVKGELSETRSS